MTSLRIERLTNIIGKAVAKKAEEVQSFSDIGMDNLATRASDQIDIYLKLNIDLKKDEKKKPFVSSN